MPRFAKVLCAVAALLMISACGNFSVRGIPGVPWADLLSSGGGTVVADKTLVGVYKGFGAANRVNSYETWLNRRVDVILDFLPASTWSELTGTGYSTFTGAWAGNFSRLVIGVPMLPTGAAMTDSEVATALQQGANGDFDSSWISLRDQLINDNLGGTTLCIGSEFNTNDTNWRASADPVAWKAYYQRIVGILRGHPSQRFNIVFNPAVGVQAMDAMSVYPGDLFVDTIGLDVWDTNFTGDYPYPSGATPMQILNAQKDSWAKLVGDGSDRGIAEWRTFAKTHGKSFAVPQWAVWSRPDGHGGGDDSYFVQQMSTLVSSTANEVLFAIYFDRPNGAADGNHALYTDAGTPTDFPIASGEYKRLFGM